MVFYVTLFLAFLYFKIARVYKKEEKSNANFWVLNSIVALAIAALIVYGFMNETWYIFLIVSYLFFIAASLIVSAVQLGVFIDGKPFVKISHLFQSLAIIGMFISFADLYLWGI
ncbi:hypothetical protein [Sulfurimonas sp.]|uniref:hypothetical protein n=1 Tax=Sulfurimonas sp. TaxID=2022749 RepID=UPI00260E9A93|nr:hypothetical protein [Sulfurimonas sp.]